jgi:hypothetical protein
MSLADIARALPSRAASSGGMKVALTLSLALNLFVAGGVTVALLQPKPPAAAPPGPEKRIEMLGAALGITPDQSAALAAFRTALVGSIDTGRAENRPLVAAFWAEAGKAQPDPAALKSLLDRILANRHATQDRIGAAFLHFIEQLPPDKRAQLAAAAADGKDPRAQLAHGLLGN